MKLFVLAVVLSLLSICAFAQDHSRATTITALEIKHCEAFNCKETTETTLINLPKNTQCTALNAIVLSLLWLEANKPASLLIHCKCTKFGKNNA